MGIFMFIGLRLGFHDDFTCTLHATAYNYIYIVEGQMKILTSLFIPALIAMSGISLFLNGISYGFYEPVTKTAYCTDRAMCLHEVGHKADHQKGWISQSKDYQEHIEAYRQFLWDHPEFRDEFSNKIYTFPGIGSPLVKETNPFRISWWFGGWGDYLELYPSVLAWSDGKEENCPYILRQYYDWDFINSEMKTLEVENGRLSDFKKDVG